MKTIVAWGHWFVIALFTLAAFDSLSQKLIPDVIRALRSNSVTFYPVYIDALFGLIPAVFCAWGILKWRQWSRALALLLVGLALVGVVIVAPLIWGVGATDAMHVPMILYAIPFALAMTWLLHPVVRMEFAQRAKAA